ncbi:hypothetical protein KMZ32_16310 [Phycicoccus sp. MAQZ13P-2]|uniref:hypothetical protein n=1 Tax=Phycicoccus mangrovi TaxID=2840470 RepID=UPI001C001955|nr:hypothetical protein [Phycicoccus mangrovi]MBT9257483.1 hypothetical protein [Phycicoccus mangrovi]MBT9275643.1 hypothetical protein [Phycicoccus mangrovi]
MRELLTEPDRLSADELVRAWPEMVQAGQELMAATRTPTGRGWADPVRVDEVAERLRVMSDGLHAQLLQRGWPGAGVGDPRLVAVSDVFVVVHDRVQRRWRPPVIERSDVAADAAAVRAHVLHTLYVGTHAVLLAVRRETVDVRARPGAATRVRSRRLAALRYTDGRLESAERMLAGPVYRVYPAALAGQHVEQPRPGRIDAALGRWDLAAHHALARSPHLGTLLEISRVQAASTAMTRAVLAAVDDGSRQCTTSEIDAGLASAAAAWQTLHADVRTATDVPDRAIAPELTAAGAELIAAFSEVLTIGTENASAAAIRRATSTNVVSALSGAVAAQVDLATAVVDTVMSEPLELSAHAARDLARRVDLTAPNGSLRAVVTPAGAAPDRRAALPPELRDVLLHRATHVRRLTGSLSSMPFAHKSVDVVEGERVRQTDRVPSLQATRLTVAGRSR